MKNFQLRYEPGAEFLWCRTVYVVDSKTKQTANCITIAGYAVDGVPTCGVHAVETIAKMQPGDDKASKRKVALQTIETWPTKYVHAAGEAVTNGG